MVDSPRPIGASGRFRDRADAGRELAQRLLRFARRPDVLVLGLPRGGVVVGSEIAAALGVAFDVWLVRKLGVPDHAELAMGALSSQDVVYVDEHLVRALGITADTVREVVERERRELARRELAYRRGRAAPRIGGQTLIVVDDGVATGSTMRAALVALRSLAPERIVMAVPVASREARAELAAFADECVCVACPARFQAVGEWYDDFSQTSDEAVIALLDHHWSRGEPDGGAAR